MSDIWVISDTHFSHKNILTFNDKVGKPIRPFSSVEDMNETIIENWNKVVKKGDKVYHLVDVVFGDKKDFGALWARLNGSKRLVVGNHDNIKFMAQGGYFQKIMLWRIFKDWGLFLTHVPQRVDQFRSDFNTNGSDMLNVHGHIHQNKSPDGPYKCVCVEQVDYTPVNLEELRIR